LFKVPSKIISYIGVHLLIWNLNIRRFPQKKVKLSRKENSFW
jgi:hypothetical protein